MQGPPCHEENQDGIPRLDVGTQFKRMPSVPDTYRAFLDFDKRAFKDGAISSKTKELIALGIARSPVPVVHPGPHQEVGGRRRQ